MHEFPDVFAYPHSTTTKPYHEDALHRVDAADSAPEQPPFEVIKTKDGEEVHVSRPTYSSVSVPGAAAMTAPFPQQVHKLVACPFAGAGGTATRLRPA